MWVVDYQDDFQDIRGHQIQLDLDSSKQCMFLWATRQIAASLWSFSFSLLGQKKIDDWPNTLFSDQFEYFGIANGKINYNVSYCHCWTFIWHDYAEVCQHFKI